MAKRLRLFAISIVAFRINPEFEQCLPEDADLVVFRRRPEVMASTAGPIDFQSRLCSDVSPDQAAAHRRAMEHAEVCFPAAAGWTGHQACEMEICPVQTFKRGFG